MNALRLAALALTFTGLLVAAAIGCGDNVLTITPCITPTLDEKGADGGSDPCHCDPPPSLNLAPCGCLSDPQDQQSIDDYRQCIVTFNGEKDAGTGGSR